MGKLTTADVERAGQGMYGDGDGLWLQVSGPQSKSWIYRYTLNGKPRWFGLGSTRDVSLPNARKKRDKARVQVREGVDLVSDRKQAKAAHKLGEGVTFRQAAESYIGAQQNGDAAWSNPKHAAQWSATLKTYAYPILADVSMESIERSHIIRVLEPIWTTKAETARRLRGRIETIIDWSIARGDRTIADNPASRGPLVKGLPKQARIKGHHAALSYAGIGAFMRDLRTREGIAALALEFAILTAARTGETLGATWDEINVGECVWTVSASRMKARRAHSVPLSPPAIAVLERARQAGQGSDFVFPNTERGRPLSNMALLKVLERLGRPDLTTHGFRATFKTWASECTGYQSEIVEAALAHVAGDKVVQAYMRGTLFTKRQALMIDWARFCDAAGDTGKVLPLRGVS